MMTDKTGQSSLSSLYVVLGLECSSIPVSQIHHSQPRRGLLTARRLEVDDSFLTGVLRRPPKWPLQRWSIRWIPSPTSTTCLDTFHFPTQRTGTAAASTVWTYTHHLAGGEDIIPNWFLGCFVRCVIDDGVGKGRSLLVRVVKTHTFHNNISTKQPNTVRDF